MADRYLNAKDAFVEGGSYADVPGPTARRLAAVDGGLGVHSGFLGASLWPTLQRARLLVGVRSGRRVRIVSDPLSVCAPAGVSTASKAMDPTAVSDIGA